MLERAIDCLRFNRASAKTNSDSVLSRCRSCSLQFVGFTLFLAMFYFPGDISVFFILWRFRVADGTTGNPAKGTICDIQPGIERLAFSILGYFRFLCTCRSYFVIYGAQKDAVCSKYNISDRIQFVKISTKAIREMNRVNLMIVIASAMKKKCTFYFITNYLANRWETSNSGSLYPGNKVSIEK